MNIKDISEARDPDLRSSMIALRRASELARKTAIQTDTEIVIVVEGKIVRLDANALRRQSAT